jgi:hypothetical protein
MSRDDFDATYDAPASAYPGANAPFNSQPYYTLTPPAHPQGGAASGGAANAGTTAPATGATGSTAATAGTVGPDIVLGPDGQVYGYARNWDPAANGGKGGYTYDYRALGPVTDLNTVSLNSGIPLGMVTQAVQQQQVTLNTMAQQGVINPYSGTGMSQQALTFALDQVRTAQQYNSALAMQQVDPATGMTYAQMGNVFDTRNTAFQYANQNQSQQATLYGYQRANAQGANYNAASGVGGMTWGQLGLQNDNSQAMQQYAYSQNYAAANPYTGMTNGQTSLAASNAGSAVSLQKDTYSLSPSAYSGGQSRLDYEQGITDRQDAFNDIQSAYNRSHQAEDNTLKDLNRAYDTSAAQYNISHQANQQALSTYREGLQGQQAATQSQSRNLSGLGWAGITKPVVAGWS